METRVQHHKNISKHTILLDGFYVGPPKWLVFERGSNRTIHEGMKDTSNVKVHLKTSSGNVNIE